MSEPARKKKRIKEEEALPAHGMIGAIRLELGPRFSTRSRLKVRGLNVQSEKEKVSLTLDREIVQLIKTETGPKAFSTTVNQLLHLALEQARLRQLLEELEADKGPAPESAYQELLTEWFQESS